MIRSALFAEQTVQNFFICILHAAKVAAEAVFVKLFAGFRIPEAAGIGMLVTFSLPLRIN